MSPLSKLQTREQRRVLDTVSSLRKCGLESVLSLPQVVVCGDQSSGKSSVLEALTEIPFPRNDNLCTRFATEISLRHELTSSLTVRIIPDPSRAADEQQKMKNYAETILDFDDLPRVMARAQEVMGISDSKRAFAADTLSVDITGPDRPHLTLVDIPGLIQAATKGISVDDVAMVSTITARYISKPRTICLAVVSATNDAANQSILQEVRKYDPDGKRTLGIITKPDRLNAGSGAEDKFLELARNEDVCFKLGWHVVKNRAFEEKNFSLSERNASEKDFFSISAFKQLPAEHVGIETLRPRLSKLLFEHIKEELPRLQYELETALASTTAALKSLGKSRATVAECRAFLTEFNMNCYELCRDGVRGLYDNKFFKGKTIDPDAPAGGIPSVRIRAVVQEKNNAFSGNVGRHGRKYHFELIDEANEAPKSSKSSDNGTQSVRTKILSRPAAITWVSKLLRVSRGVELVGNFNPNLVAELFWEQSEKWQPMSEAHLKSVANSCCTFLKLITRANCPPDNVARVWLLILERMKVRQEAAALELQKLIQDREDFPINYNHYYTENIHKKRHDRAQAELAQHMSNTTDPEVWCKQGSHYYYPASKLGPTEHVKQAMLKWSSAAASANMEEHSCEEALDCLVGIYKVQMKTFVANVVTQVVERHLMRGLQDVFSSMSMIEMTDEQIESAVAEPAATKKQRDLLTERIKKLEEGEDILLSVLSA